MAFFRQTWTLVEKTLTIVLARHFVGTLVRALIAPVMLVYHRVEQLRHALTLEQLYVLHILCKELLCPAQFIWCGIGSSSTEPQ